jgi:hypothetical protein
LAQELSWWSGTTNMTWNTSEVLSWSNILVEWMRASEARVAGTRRSGNGDSGKSEGNDSNKLHDQTENICKWNNTGELNDSLVCH